MLNLKNLLAALGRKQTNLAGQIGVSVATVNLICNYGRWPKTSAGGGGEKRLRERITAFLTANGATAEQIATAFNEAPDMPCVNKACPMAATAAHSGPQAVPQREDNDMLPPKSTITADARDHFHLERDPFNNDVRQVADFFMNESIRRVRSAVRNVAQFGGMLALIAESGAGKSTLRKDLAHWIKSSDQPVILIEPFIIGMEDHARKGRPLRSEDIVTAVIRRVSPGTPVRQSHQPRIAQMHDSLRNSAEAGNRHVLVIEEAHRLARSTIRHLKGFYELDDGFSSLLSIIIIGQTELDWKLGDNDFELREVVQRLEKRYLEPMDNDIERYLRHKFDRIGASYDKVFTTDVPDAVLARLRVTTETRLRGQRTLGPRSQCYPLAINNLVAGAINLAHQSGEDKVSAKLITQVGREVEQ
ncbi:ExeA family protein [Variovorax sp.]|uniref:ExeA family protein n=1 Tax=Variovorax sp. TaxID=1871043 RepID=UPI003BABABAC